MDSALHRDFTLKNMIIRAMLDAQMKHITMSVPVPQRNHLLHELDTRLFLQSLQYGIVVLGFLDAFV